MNSDDKSPTSCQDPPAKTSKIVINLFLDPKMRSPREVGTSEVMFGVRGDCVCPILPRGHFLLGLKSKL